MRMHPRHDGWLLLLVKRPGCNNPGSAVECPHDLMLTKVRLQRSGNRVQGLGSGCWSSGPAARRCATVQCPHDLMLTKVRRLNVSSKHVLPGLSSSRAARACCAYMQDLFGATSWVNLTANTGGSIAAFVDFDWAANLCPRGLAGCPVQVSKAIRYGKDGSEPLSSIEGL